VVDVLITTYYNDSYKNEQQLVYKLKKVYTMLIADAAKILNLSGTINADIIKQAYRMAAKKYHPDVNPAGVEMMQFINNAYDTLKEYKGEELTETTSNYPEELNSALMAILGLIGLDIEICGAWVWVTGDTRTHKEVLKENGYKYASKKKAWNFRPNEWKSKSRGKSTMGDIRMRYGSTTPAQPNYDRLSYA